MGITPLLVTIAITCRRPRPTGMPQVAELCCNAVPVRTGPARRHKLQVGRSECVKLLVLPQGGWKGQDLNALCWTARPLREKLIETARRREIDSVLVWRLDRGGWSLVDLVNTLQELTALDVGFISLSEALDLTTPSGRALTGMLVVFAEFKRDILRTG